MPIAFYLDVSVLIKRYHAEAGSDFVIRIFESGNDTDSVLCSARLTFVEFGSFVMRLKRENEITHDDAYKLFRSFRNESFMKIFFIDMNPQIESIAIEIMSNHPLKASDAIQLATAKDIQERYDGQIVFLSSDRQLFNAAQSVGMNTINPIDEGAMNDLESL